MNLDKLKVGSIIVHNDWTPSTLGPIYRIEQIEPSFHPDPNGDPYRRWTLRSFVARVAGKDAGKEYGGVEIVHCGDVSLGDVKLASEEELDEFEDIFRNTLNRAIQSISSIRKGKTLVDEISINVFEE